MRYLNPIAVVSKKIVNWNYYNGDDNWREPEKGLTIIFDWFRKESKRDAFKDITEILNYNGVNWLFEVENKWFINIDKLKLQFNEFSDLEWFRGEVNVIPEYEDIEEERFNKIERKKVLKFMITEKEIIDNYPKKIFLSHKGIDKPIIRNYQKTLETIGFSTWMDEDSLAAGDELERSLLQGFKDSCAAVFFITPSFKDENFLSTEINYAIAEKRNKKEKFSIITLIFPSAEGKKGIVPELLKQYVWKEPETELEALREIIKALPIQVGKILWKN